MKALPQKYIEIDGEHYMTVCSASEATHLTIVIPGPQGKITLPVITKGDRRGTPCWTWNGDVEKPTLKPSVLSQCGHYAPQFQQGEHCWCTNPNDYAFKCYRCHTWINDGNAQFLDDCSHEHKGKTLPLGDIDK